MSDLSNAPTARMLGINPLLARMPSADIAMLRAKSGMTPQKLQQVKEAANDFEALFVSEMLSNMSNSVEPDPLFGGGDAEDTWKGMMNQEIGKEVARSGGIGLSDDIMAKMIEMQGGAQDAATQAAGAPLPAALQKYITADEGASQ